MRNADPRGAHGAGFWPLQAHREAFTAGGGVKGRAAMYGMRMIDVPRGPLVNARMEEGTLGDLSGYFIWQKTTRPLPTWREVMPARAVAKHEGSTGTGFGLPGAPDERAPGPPIFIEKPPAAPPQQSGTAIYIIPIKGPPGSASQAALDAAIQVGLGLFKKDHPTGTITGTPISVYNVGPHTLTLKIQYLFSSSDEEPPDDDPPDSDDAEPGDPGSDPVGPDDGPDLELVPVGGTAYNPDHSLVKVPYQRPAGWPKFPIDYYFNISACTDTASQVTFPGAVDPRLVAVNQAGGPGCGTWVCDLDKDSRFDPTRSARLHSAFRVIKAPAQSGETSAAFGNSLALQFGRSGRGDVPGGYAYDKGILGMWSWRRGGAMCVGKSNDKHKIGKDADGHPINPMHLQTGALFTNDLPGVTGGGFDGPLHFETSWPDPTDKTPYKNLVHMGWNAKATYGQIGGGVHHGKWGWWTTSPMSVSTPSGPPTTPGIPTNPKPPPFGPGAPNGPLPDPSPTFPIVGTGNGFGLGGSRGEIDTSVVPYQAPKSFETVQKINSRILSWPRQYAVMQHELAGPGYLARPQRYVQGVPDTRYTEGQTDEAVANVEATSPIVGRLSAYGAQGGKLGGPNVVPTTGGTQKPQPWIYTQKPGQSRHPSGTANGGLVFTPPEVDLSDVDDSLAPTGLTRSSAYFIMAPGTGFGFGLPELATGGFRSGYGLTGTATSLVIALHDSLGAGTTQITLETLLATLADGFKFAGGTVAGTKIGTAASQKLGFFGVTAVVQPTTTGTVTGFTAGAGTAVRDDSTFTGDSGSKAYTIGDIVRALKDLGLLAAS